MLTCSVVYLLVSVLRDCCVIVAEDAVETREPSGVADAHANVALESAAAEHVPIGYVRIACVHFFTSFYSASE